MRIIAVITEAAEGRAILEPVGKPVTPAGIASARGPPAWYEGSGADAIAAEAYRLGDLLARPEPESEDARWRCARCCPTGGSTASA